MQRTVRAAALIFVMTASPWTSTVAAAEPAAANSVTPATQSASAVRSGPASGRASLFNPAELRSALLYGGRLYGGRSYDSELYGAREFSTFQHSSTRGRRRSETRVLTRSFDPQSEDRWLAFDKVQHLTFSFLWTLGTQYVVVNKGRISEHNALPLSISSSAAAGVSKELYDLRIGPSRYFSTKDLVADAVGILLATGLILL